MKNQAYFDLLEIVKTQDQLDKLGERLIKTGIKLLERAHQSDSYALSPTDRPYEVFDAKDE